MNIAVAVALITGTIAVFQGDYKVSRWVMWVHVIAVFAIVICLLFGVKSVH